MTIEFAKTCLFDLVAALYAPARLSKIEFVLVFMCSLSEKSSTRELLIDMFCCFVLSVLKF